MKFSFLPILFIQPLLALPEGYTVEEWAGPFDVEYPTAITAAADGTVYVSVDRNGSVGKLPNNMGKVVSCRDTNGDGKADQFIDFVPSVDSPRGGHFVRDTLYLIHPPFLSSFRDTNGDGVADEHKVLLENIGFGLQHPRGADHTTNGCRMGIDGWLYIAVGDFGMEGTKGTDGKVVTLHGGGVARVRPDGTDLEVYSYHTRNICDVAISPRLDLFTRDNTNDGKGWDIRVHHFTNGSEHGYPRLYKNFADESIEPMLDLGGGSGTGALYLAEPGHDEMLLTCDWTTGKIYLEKLTEDGASFKAEESIFMDLVRAVDIDVDGESNLYVCDWRNGRFRFAGEGVKIGMIQKLSKKNLKVEPFPDLRKLGYADLLSQLKSKSAVRRLEAQREILARGGDDWTPALFNLSQDQSQALETRIAAVFTLAQMDDVHAHRMLAHGVAPWSAESRKFHEFQARAMGESGGETLEKNLDHLALLAVQKKPRVQLQGLIALMQAEKLAPKYSETILNFHERFQDPRLFHTVMQALVKFAHTDVLLNHSDKKLARLALMRIHRPEVISGIAAQLNAADDEQKFALLEVIARLYHREGEWDKVSWWGTRPDDRGPYFDPVEWEGTVEAKAIIEKVFGNVSKTHLAALLEILSKNRIPISALDLGDQDPVELALISPRPTEGQIPILVGAAIQGDRPWEQRLAAYRALPKVPEVDVLYHQIKILGTWLEQGTNPDEVTRELSDFTNQPDLAWSNGKLRQIASKESKQMSRVAWQTLLTVLRSPLTRKDVRKKVRQMVNKNPREEGLFLALADLRYQGFDKQIANAIDSDNDTLIEAARHAKKIIAEAKASGGKLVSEFKPAEVAKLAMAAQGDSARGKEIFTSQGCIACHAVDQKAAQKGPYLGSSGSKFTKDYLIESILDPNAVVAQGFQTELITMKDNKAHLGFVTREEDGEIDLRDIAGTVKTLKEDAIGKREHQPTSMMPPGLASTLTVEDFNALIAYLISMKE